MTYKEDENLSELRVGDILERKDGTMHEAVPDKKGVVCWGICSNEDGNCYALKCGSRHFHFVKLDE